LVEILSFKDMGIPSKGINSSPAAILSSTFFAVLIASSPVTLTYAFIVLFCFSMLLR